MFTSPLNYALTTMFDSRTLIIYAIASFYSATARALKIFSNVHTNELLFIFSEEARKFDREDERFEKIFLGPTSENSQ